MKTFSETELLKYDGSDPTLPIYLAIDEIVYDVSANPRMYGKVCSMNNIHTYNLRKTETIRLMI